MTKETLIVFVNLIIHECLLPHQLVAHAMLEALDDFLEYGLVEHHFLAVHDAGHIATPLLAWLLLLSIAYSCYEGSGLSLALCRALKGEKLEFKQRLGIRVALIVLVVIIANTLLLLLTPHAVLLSPSGDIFPSPFSKSIVPIVAGAVSLVSFAYGLAGGTINNIDTAFKTLYCKLPSLLPVLILYIFAAQLYACICFVF